MLRIPALMGRRGSRRRSLAAACGLLSVAVLVAGVTLRASAAPAPEPNKEEPKKVEPKAAQPPADEFPGLANLDDLLKNLPANVPPEQLKMMRANVERLKKMMEQQRQNGAPGFNFPNVPFNPGLPASSPQGLRLGVAVEKPSDTLAEQLELPKDQGLVIREVMADSAASKAGLKTHDILLELDGKAVSNNPEDFRKTVEGIKADTPVDAVVLRKGKKETLKGLSLPEAKAAAPGFPANFRPGFGPLGPEIPALPFTPPNAVAPGVGVGFAAASGNGVTTTTTRTNDHFTTRHQEGNLVITLTGKVTDGKAAVNEITVQDGGESKTYDALDKVPEKYRDKAKSLVEMSEKGSVKVESKTP